MGFSRHGCFPGQLICGVIAGRLTVSGKIQYIADFEKLPQDERIRTARKFAALQPHQTADKAIHKMLRSLSNIGKDDPHVFHFFFTF
jgi:hypothetical protein